MKSLAILFPALLLLPPAGLAGDLAPVRNTELASVLGLLEELATTPFASEQPYIVRIYAAPAEVGECWGAISTCPDVRLYFTVSTDDLGDVPVLYQLPSAKGWEFGGWLSPGAADNVPQSSFVLRTTLPESNVDSAARKAWRSQEYRLVVGPSAASYVRR